MQAKNNDIVLAAVNGEFNVKYFQQKGDRKWLVAANPLYKPVEIVDGMEFSIFGVVAWVLIETRLCNNVRTR
jgi:DNA polymerase V